MHGLLEAEEHCGEGEPQEGPECGEGAAILKQNGQGKPPLRKHWMSKCDREEGADRRKSGNGAPGTGTARLEEGLRGHAGGTVPGEGWRARGRANRSQAGLVCEGWSDNCGFYWERRRITGGFPDFLEPPGVICQLQKTRALQGRHRTAVGARRSGEASLRVTEPTRAWHSQCCMHTGFLPSFRHFSAGLLQSLDPFLQTRAQPRSQRSVVLSELLNHCLHGP